MTKEDFKMPSGTEYGRKIKHGYVDGEFVLGMFVSVAGEERTYNWVVEHRDGDVILVEHHEPLHEPVFGIDAGDWLSWVVTTYAKIDAYKVSKLV